MRRPIYTSDLISKPEIKKILDEFIVYPMTKDKPSLLVDKNIKYDNTLLGNAVEILFEILANGNSRINSPVLKSYKKIFSTTASKYKKHKNSDDYYLIPTNSNGSFSSGIIPKEQLEGYCKTFNINSECLVKVKTLFHDFNNSLNVLSDKNCFIKNLDNSLFAVLIIANVLPLCKRFDFFNVNYKRINENTITCLKKIFESFPEDYINLKEKVISEQQISIAGTVGRLDYIIGSSLIEIKSTQQFLTQGHLRQVALYYLGLEKLKKIRIDKVSIFYSLYGKMVSYKTEEIFRLNQKDNIQEKLNNFWKPQPILEPSVVDEIVKGKL